MSFAVTLDVRMLDLDDVMQCIRNAGYDTPDRDFALAHENDLFKYVGTNDRGDHKFLIGFENEEADHGEWYASMVYISLGRDGKLQGEYGGMPEFETNDVEKLVEYINAQCN